MNLLPVFLRSPFQLLQQSSQLKIQLQLALNLSNQPKSALFSAELGVSVGKGDDCRADKGQQGYNCACGISPIAYIKSHYSPH